MKKATSFFMIVLTVVFILGGCQSKKASKVLEEPKIKKEKKSQEISFPKEFAGEYWFSSGAGAWRTYLVLKDDGTFTGEHTDTNMGESGDGYEATQYICNFEGEFKIVEENDGVYTAQLTKLSSEKEINEEWIKDDVRYVASTPYGIDGGSEFILYPPSTPTEELSEELLSWWPKRFETVQPDTLTQYAIYNVTTGEGFFAD